MASLFRLCLVLLVAVAHGFAVGPHHGAHHHYNHKSNNRKSKTALHLELPVDPLVLAAGGLAVVGGLGTVLLTSRIGEMDATEPNGASSSSSSTAAATTTPDTTTTATPTPTPTPATTASTTATTVDLSIPYDAAAKLAYETAGSPGDYAAFKTKYEADAVADVKAKQK